MRRLFTIAATALLIRYALMPAFSAETIHGSWNVRGERESRRVELNVRNAPNAFDGNENISFGIGTSALRITPADIESEHDAVTLSLVREAGSFEGTGTISHGSGGGTFVFSPNEAFRTAMNERGYPQLSTHDCLNAAMLNLTTAYIDALRQRGYATLPLHDVWSFLALKVDAEFIRSMQAAFRTNALDAHELTSLRALGVTSAYLASMRDSGFPIDVPEDAVKFRALGIDGAYVRRVEAHGFAHPTSDQLVKLKVLNVVYATCPKVLS